MEVVKRTTKTRKSKPKAKTNTVTTLVVKKTPKRQKSQRQRRSGVPRLLRGRAQLTRSFENALLYADIFGPQRWPRPGSSPRTLLGMDAWYGTLTGSATNTVQGYQMGTMVYPQTATSHTPVTLLQATGEGVQVSWGIGTNALGSCYPPTGWVDDASLTTAEMIIRLEGTLTNVTGMMLVGTGPPIPESTCSWNNLVYVPGVTMIPIAQLLSGPIRIPLVHVSQASWEFLDPGEYVPDVMTPYFVSSGLPTTCKLRVEVVRCWEVRVRYNSGVPYEVGADSSTDHNNAFQDASSYVAGLASVVSQAIPPEVKAAGIKMGVQYFGRMFNSMMENYGLPSLSTGHHRALQGQGALRIEL